MQLQTKKRLAYLISLTLFFSYVEFLLPRIVPFFRLGLANIVILSAFSMDFVSFSLLSILKSIASSLISGTLFTPFAIISLIQSLSSGFVMYFLFRLNNFFKNKFLSLYGLSVTGAVVSAFIQILFSSIYLGSGTFALLGPMLIFNTVCGIITAFFAEILELPDFISNLNEQYENKYILETQKVVTETRSKHNSEKFFCKKNTIQIFKLFLILILSFSVFFIKNLYILILIFVFSLVFQKISRRKILILPHLFMWLFVLITGLLTPEGKVIFEFLSIKITYGALILTIQKALRLSIVSALSQCLVQITMPEGSILSYAISYYKNLTEILHASEGSLWQRVKMALNAINPVQ